MKEYEYKKPKLTELKIINKIISKQNIEILNEQNIEITNEKKIFNLIINNYKIIIIIIIIIIGLYWRYNETKIKKKKNLLNDNIFEFI